MFIIPLINMQGITYAESSQIYDKMLAALVADYAECPAAATAPPPPSIC